MSAQLPHGARGWGVPRCWYPAVLLGLSVLSACTREAAIANDDSIVIPAVSLQFQKQGGASKRISLKELGARAKPEVVETDDPYYLRRKRFRAIPLAAALTYAFGETPQALRSSYFLLRANDGYAVPIEGARLLEGGAYIAFADLDVAGFEPIGPQKVSPAPAYLIWNGPGQGNLDTHPRPWQLASIEIVTYEALYPHTLPSPDDAGAAAQAGLGLFRDHCIKCHAINREGGRVGPDLNVPQNIVEYRPEAQIRQYIKNPRTFRYSAMPAHPSLTEPDLDRLLAYLRAMAARKHDPDAEVQL